MKDETIIESYDAARAVGAGHADAIDIAAAHTGAPPSRTTYVVNRALDLRDIEDGTKRVHVPDVFPKSWLA